MNVIIIEDEELAARRLEKMILEIDPAINIMAKLESVEDSVKWFQNHPQPELIFLDVHLEDDLSFAIFDKVKVSAPIIFTTAFDEYAIKAFKLKSIDYLLKPIIKEDLAKAIKKYKEWSIPENQVIDLNSLYEIITRKSPRYRERFSITIGQKIKSFEVTEISFIYSEGGFTNIVLDSRSEYPVDFSLDKLEEELDPEQFFRINRQMLIRRNSIKNVHVYPKSRLKIELNPVFKEDVFVSLDKVTRFKDWLGR